MRAREARVAGVLRAAVALLVAVGLAISLASCGKKARPKPAEDTKSEYPRTYPKE
jgi:hypothetical protein